MQKFIVIVLTCLLFGFASANSISEERIDGEHTDIVVPAKYSAESYWFKKGYSESTKQRKELSEKYLKEVEDSFPDLSESSKKRKVYLRVEEEITRQAKNELEAMKEKRAARSKALIDATKKNFGEFSIAVSKLDIYPDSGFTLELLFKNETTTKLLYGYRFVNSFTYHNEQGGESTGYGAKWSVLDNYGNRYMSYSMRVSNRPKDQFGPGESTRAELGYRTKPIKGCTLKIMLHEFMNGEYPTIEVPAQFTNYAF